MKKSLPIRVLVAGGSTTERDQVERAIQLDQSFAIVPLKVEQPAGDVDADALVLIQEEAPEATGADAMRPPVLPIPMGGTPAVVVASKDGDQGRLPGLSELPRVLRRAVLNSQIAATAQQMAADALQERADAPAEENETSQMATRAMRESQRLAAIGKLTAEIAHEINNPLESVGNLLYLAMREPGMPGSACEYLRTAERELARIVQISKQTLSFSRESAEPVPVRVTELMDEVVGLYSRRIGQKKLAVIREYSATELIPGLPGELRQVFSNLVTNAIEATSPGGLLRLRIRTVVQHRGGESRRGLRITVGDSGVGIPESVRSRIGQIFFTTKGEAGTGLGLWVTGGVIARYGGTLQVRSSTGAVHGTVFSIFLPLPADANVPEREDGDRAIAGNVTEISRHPSYSHLPQRGAESALAQRKRNG